MSIVAPPPEEVAARPTAAAGAHTTTGLTGESPRPRALDRRQASHEDEQALIEQARTDSEAFATLYERHVDRLYGYVYDCVRDRLAADEIVAETFQRAVTLLTSTERHEAPFSLWLYRLATHALSDHRRHRPSVLPDHTPVHAGDASSPTEGQESSGRREAVLAAVTYLPQLQRQVLLLRFGQELRMHDVAFIVGQTEAAVRILLYRGLRTLQHRLGGDGTTQRYG